MFMKNNKEVKKQKELKMQVLGSLNKPMFFGTSVQGSSHKEKNVECQDYSLYKTIKSKGNKTYAVAAIADGVGSCINSAIGAKTAVETVVNYITEKLTESVEKMLKTETYEKIIREGFDEAYNAVIDYADNHEMAPLTLASTLTAVIYDGINLSFGHIGDCGVVVVYNDKTVEMITKRNKGDTASSVIPLISNGNHWSFGTAGKPVSAFFAMTDGVLDTVVGTEALDEIVYWPFLQQFVKKENKKEKNCVLASTLTEYMQSEAIAQRITDDISLVVCKNLKGYSDPDFDLEDYTRKINEFYEKQNKLLYADYDKFEQNRIKETAEAVEPEQNVQVEATAEAQTETVEDEPEKIEESANTEAAEEKIETEDAVAQE